MKNVNKNNNKNNELLQEFSFYCITHPKERFFQALRNWMNVSKIYIETYNEEVDDNEVIDTFYWTKNKYGKEI